MCINIWILALLIAIPSIVATKLEYYGKFPSTSGNLDISMCTEDWRSSLDYDDVPYSICHVCSGKQNTEDCQNRHVLSPKIRINTTECQRLFNDEYLSDINNDDCFCPRPLKQRYVRKISNFLMRQKITILRRVLS